MKYMIDYGVKTEVRLGEILWGVFALTVLAVVYVLVYQPDLLVGGL